MSKVYGPDGRAAGPTPAELQAAAIAQQLRIARLALRILAVLLSEKEGRKFAIRKDRLAKLEEKYPGGVVRFGEEAERITVRLMTPAELDAADVEAQRLAAARVEQLEKMTVGPEASA